jgi:hypothetical protein
MSNNEKGSYETTTETFDQLQALIMDARGNALFMGEVRRLRYGATYLRLCCQQAAALADLIDAVADEDRRRGNKAKGRIEQNNRAILKHLDVVAVDNARLVDEGKAVALKGEEVDALLDKLCSGYASNLQ